MMYYSDDPIRDYARYDAELQDELESLPVCDICGEPVQDDHYYAIGGDIVCPDCLERNFRKEVEEYIE